MGELMTVTVEVWPVAADEAGIWLVSGGDAWRFGPLEAASDVHYEVELLLFQHDIDPDDAVMFIRLPGGTPATEALHSTSWRPHGPTIVLTYMAVVKADGYALETWPDAAPITAELAAKVKKAPPHGAAEVPVPRVIDVPLHGLRHLRFLMDYDAETSAALDANWRRHLAPLEPALFTMFSERLAG
ncbi:MAG TPA: hypothetical protein VNH17_10430 [Streptosporangiaceae bacterium]|nr:hypothetical protein [Streptosporangiaceae bacterium]